MKIAIELGMLVRMSKKVIVDVPDDFKSWTAQQKQDLMAEVYQQDEGDGFTEDNSWGCEEATHYLLASETDGDPQFKAQFEDDSVEVMVSAI